MAAESSLILITGGVRSGKSAFAERYAARLLAGRPSASTPQPPNSQPSDLVYIATAQVGDEEMAARVARHRARRPAAWRTVEAPLQIGAAVADAEGAGVVLVDSVDFWVSNRLLEADPVAGTRLDHARLDALEAVLLAEADDVIAACRRIGAHLILVTLEVGMGIVPPYPLGRAFRDLLGRVNGAFAAAADAVYLLVAGLPVELKRLSAQVGEERGT